MVPFPTVAAGRPATGATGPRLPASAQRLRLPLHSRSQQRMAARWGFDLNAADASARAETLLAESPNDSERLLLVASVRSRRGAAAGGLPAARPAVAADGRSGRAHTTLAALLARSGDTAAAGTHAETGAGLEPDDPTALYNRGLTRWTSGQRDAARADFARAAELLGVDTAPRWRRLRPR
jgi:Flp pilus assembly protein TadD